jgi:hypothetical protein
VGSGVSEGLSANAGTGDRGFGSKRCAREVGTHDAEGDVDLRELEGARRAGCHEAVVADERGGEIASTRQREQRVNGFCALRAIGFGACDLVTGIRFQTHIGAHGAERGRARFVTSLIRIATEPANAPVALLVQMPRQQFECFSLVAVDGVPRAPGRR